MPDDRRLEDLQDCPRQSGPITLRAFGRTVGAAALAGALPNTPLPSDLSRTCGGSSGGAAVALACRMVALADGTDAARFPGSLERDFKGVRVAWWRGLGGIPFEAEIREAVDAQRKVFESLDCVTEDAEPDVDGVSEAFQALRYAANYSLYAPGRHHGEWSVLQIAHAFEQATRFGRTLPVVASS